jgi:prevent-host-death family protein
MEGMRMKTAAVSKLKASLSEYLSKVKAGEEVIVTDRGKPIARIVPLKRGEMPAHLLMLEKAGMAKIGTGKLPKGFLELPRPKDPKNRAIKALLSERRQSL